MTLYDKILESITSVSGAQWVLFLTGVSVPFLVYFYNRCFQYLRNHRKNGPFAKKWFVYHWSRDDYTPTFRSEEWRIKRNFFNNLKVQTFDHERKRLSYSGRVEFEAGYVMITLKAEMHKDETINVRIQPAPIPGDEKKGMIMRGLYLDHDFDNKIYCTTFLATEKKLEEEDAINALSKLANWSDKENCLRLNQVPTVS